MLGSWCRWVCEPGEGGEEAGAGRRAGGGEREAWLGAREAVLRQLFPRRAVRCVWRSSLENLQPRSGPSTTVSTCK